MQGLVAGLWSSVYSLGEVIGPPMGGALFTNWGFPVACTAIAFLNFSMAVTIFLFYMCKGEREEEKDVMDQGEFYFLNLEFKTGRSEVKS